MISILGGLGAAVAWGCATLCVSRASREIGAASTLSLVMLVGLVAIAPFVVVSGKPAELDAEAAGWLTVAGAGSLVGLLLTYTALRIGKVSTVAPIVSTEGAIAGVIALAAGESLVPGAMAALAVVAAGVVLASSERGAEPEHRDPRLAVVLAAVAAVAFGVGLYSSGRVGGELPIAWTILPARLGGVLLVGLPVVLSGRLRWTPRALALAALAGLCEAGGFAAYVVGARDGIAVSAVLASQFAAVAAVGAFFLFRERLLRVQLAGVTAIVVGIAVLSAFQA